MASDATHSDFWKEDDRPARSKGASVWPNQVDQRPAPNRSFGGHHPPPPRPPTRAHLNNRPTSRGPPEKIDSKCVYYRFCFHTPLPTDAAHPPIAPNPSAVLLAALDCASTNAERPSSRQSDWPPGGV